MKQEHDLHGLENLEFAFPSEFASKRPLEGDADITQSSEANKRLKSDAIPSGDAEEDTLEDGLALLVQNALSNVGDLVDQFGTDSGANGVPDDPMDLDATLGLDTTTTSSKPSSTFFAEPSTYIQQVQTHALANTVCTPSSSIDEST